MIFSTRKSIGINMSFKVMLGMTLPIIISSLYTRNVNYFNGTGGSLLNNSSKTFQKQLLAGKFFTSYPITNTGLSAFSLTNLSTGKISVVHAKRDRVIVRKNAGVKS